MIAGKTMSVFFSLLAVFIIIGLYALFLGDVWVNSFTDMTGVRYLMNTWILAGLSVFFRDLAHLMQPLSMLLLFLSPLFYPLSRVRGVVKAGHIFKSQDEIVPRK